MKHKAFNLGRQLRYFCNLILISKEGGRAMGIKFVNTMKNHLIVISAHMEHQYLTDVIATSVDSFVGTA